MTEQRKWADLSAEEKEIMYFKTALRLQGFSVTDRIADQIARTYEMLKEKGGDFSVVDSVGIQWEMDLKYKSKELES